MGVSVGVDVGTVSVKAALVGGVEEHGVLTTAAAEGADLFAGLPVRLQAPDGASCLALLAVGLRTAGDPVGATHQLLDRLLRLVPASAIRGVRVCGSGARLVAQATGWAAENEFRAIARGTRALCPGVDTVFEMGGHTSKYLALERDGKSGDGAIVDYEESGDCAAGTGSFLDQQALRLRIDVEEVGQIVACAQCSAKVAGRCSVFAKSDLIHAQQKGYTPAEALRGLCEAVARNYKTSVVKGRKVGGPVLFIGGVARNSGVVAAMRQAFGMGAEEMLVPPQGVWIPALGAALVERDATVPSGPPQIGRLRQQGPRQSEAFPTSPPLSMERVVLLGERVRPRVLQESDGVVDAYLGIDIGSVSTKLVALDE
ncbi:MAG: BadF/BadG/BcrA/BcrD ATPase family protein, partial [Candidatus Latescibacterota bacterium]